MKDEGCLGTSPLLNATCAPFFDVYHMVDTKAAEDLVNAINLFLCYIRCFKYTRLVPKLNQLMTVLI